MHLGGYYISCYSNTIPVAIAISVATTISVGIITTIATISPSTTTIILRITLAMAATSLHHRSPWVK